MSTPTSPAVPPPTLATPQSVRESSKRLLNELSEVAQAMGTTHGGALVAVSSVRVLLTHEGIMDRTGKVLTDMDKHLKQMDSLLKTVPYLVDPIKEWNSEFLLPDEDPVLASMLGRPTPTRRNHGKVVSAGEGYERAETEEDKGEVEQTALSENGKKSGEGVGISSNLVQDKKDNKSNESTVPISSTSDSSSSSSSSSNNNPNHDAVAS